MAQDKPADKPENSQHRAQPQSKETTVEAGRAGAAPGEVDPSADQGDRNQALAAQMQVTPVRTLDMKKADEKKAKEEAETKAKQEEKELSPREQAIAEGRNSFVNKDGEEEFIDPDELVKEEVHETIPTDTCLNCRNHGRGDVPLNKNGFCTRCGFKLSQVHNMSLEPGRKAL